MRYADGLGWVNRGGRGVVGGIGIWVIFLECWR